MPETGAAFTRVLVKVAGLRLGLLNVMIFLLFLIPCVILQRLRLFTKDAG
jgi:hypothetical protein